MCSRYLPRITTKLTLAAAIPCFGMLKFCWVVSLSLDSHRGDNSKVMWYWEYMKWGMSNEYDVKVIGQFSILFRHPLFNLQKIFDVPPPCPINNDRSLILSNFSYRVGPQKARVEPWRLTCRVSAYHRRSILLRYVSMQINISNICHLY